MYTYIWSSLRKIRSVSSHMTCANNGGVYIRHGSRDNRSHQPV